MLNSYKLVKYTLALMLTLLQGYIIGNTQVMTVHAEYKTSNQLPPPVPRSESNFSLSSQVLLHHSNAQAVTIEWVFIKTK